jgi:hypothetical protein
VISFALQLLTTTGAKSPRRDLPFGPSRASEQVKQYAGAPTARSSRAGGRQSSSGNYKNYTSESPELA